MPAAKKDHDKGYGEARARDWGQVAILNCVSMEALSECPMKGEAGRYPFGVSIPERELGQQSLSQKCVWNVLETSGSPGWSRESKDIREEVWPGDGRPCGPLGGLWFILIERESCPTGGLWRKPRMIRHCLFRVALACGHRRGG